MEELVASRKRAIGRKKMTGTNIGKLLGDLWLEEFRSVFPDYRSSKKNLFRKYKWWRQRRAEMEKDTIKSAPKIAIDKDSVLFLELKKSLSENTMELSPFVSSKVIMLAQHWVENTTVTDTRAEEEELDREMDETPEPSMITLPGGAVLVAKSGNNGELKGGRLSEPPDVSITLR